MGAYDGQILLVQQALCSIQSYIAGLAGPPIRRRPFFGNHNVFVLVANIDVPGPCNITGPIHNR
jgi:hypothetical protein